MICDELCKLNTLYVMDDDNKMIYNILMMRYLGLQSTASNFVSDPQSWVREATHNP